MPLLVQRSWLQKEAGGGGLRTGQRPVPRPGSAPQGLLGEDSELGARDEEDICIHHKRKHEG